MRSLRGMKPPKNEHIWISYYDNQSEIMFIVTSKLDRTTPFFLYEVTLDGSLHKLGKAATPQELERTYGVRDRLIKGVFG